MRFTAQGRGENVEIIWETGQEINNKGFNLYRASVINGPFRKLNAGLIPSVSSGVAGSPYWFLDADVVPGERSYYKLEDIDVMHQTFATNNTGLAATFQPFLGGMRARGRARA